MAVHAFVDVFCGGTGGGSPGKQGARERRGKGREEAATLSFKTESKFGWGESAEKYECWRRVFCTCTHLAQRLSVTNESFARYARDRRAILLGYSCLYFCILRFFLRRRERDVRKLSTLRVSFDALLSLNVCEMGDALSLVATRVMP